jgi:hypothetical protein
MTAKARGTGMLEEVQWVYKVVREAINSLKLGDLINYTKIAKEFSIN